MMDTRCLPGDDIETVRQALVIGIRDYALKNRFTTAVFGLSGGIDSALTAVLAVDALGADQVMGVSMPARYSSPGSLTDAEALAKNLGIRYEVLPIALRMLAGEQVPLRVATKHILVSGKNVFQVYPPFDMN